MEVPVREVRSPMVDFFLQAKWTTKAFEKKFEKKTAMVGEVSKKGWSDISSLWGQQKRSEYQQPCEDSSLLYQQSGSGLGAYSDNHHSSGGRAQDDDWSTASWSNNTQSSNSHKTRKNSDDWSGWGDELETTSSKKSSSKQTSSAKKKASKKDEGLLIDFGGDEAKKDEGDWANEWEEDAWESLNK